MPNKAPHRRTILCVLAGGRSSRFGASKLRVQIDGEPVLAWQARRLARGVPGRPELWLSIAPGRPLPPGNGAFSRHIPDSIAYDGPLAGMSAALAAAQPNDIVVFVPADMMMLEAVHLWGLARVLAIRKGLVGVMSRWVCGPRAGRVEPLPSIWRAGAARALIQRAMAGGVRGPSRLALRPGVALASLGIGDAAAWMSLNQRADMVVAGQLLRRRVELGR